MTETIEFRAQIRFEILKEYYYHNFKCQDRHVL